MCTEQRHKNTPFNTNTCPNTNTKADILENHFMTLPVMQPKGYCHIDCATIVSRLETFGQGRSLHLHSHTGPKLTNSNVARVKANPKVLHEDIFFLGLDTGESEK